MSFSFLRQLHKRNSHSDDKPGDREQRTREKAAGKQFREGSWIERTVSWTSGTAISRAFEGHLQSGFGGDGHQPQDMLPGSSDRRTKKRKMKVCGAFDYLVQEEENRLNRYGSVTRLAVERVKTQGLCFLDEIDKIAGREGGHVPDVSAGRRAAGHSADCGRHYRQHEVRMVSTDHICSLPPARFMCRSRAI